MHNPEHPECLTAPRSSPLCAAHSSQTIQNCPMGMCFINQMVPEAVVTKLFAQEKMKRRGGRIRDCPEGLEETPQDINTRMSYDFPPGAPSTPPLTPPSMNCVLTLTLTLTLQAQLCWQS